ncbi:MAG: hypothetical protein J5654_00600 [Victivallales bacterium]|nr:hypothetical protein [Victivallales bacterium]
MALFGHSDEDLAKREREIERKYADIKLLLQKQQNEIATKFQDLGTLDAAIMTRSNLETIYQQQLQALEEQKQSLATAIQSYQNATQEFVEKKQDLMAREQAVIAKECEAQSAFASRLDEQMQPLNQLKAELDAKAQRITLMQDEFNKNFVAQDQRLLADFQKLQAGMKESFNALQQKALEQLEQLAKREAGLNDREAELARREAEVRQGLSGERSKIFEEVNIERQRLNALEQSLRQQDAMLLTRKTELDKQDAALADRIAAVQARESEAATQFAQQKQSMLAEMQQAREAQAVSLVELQKQASAHCDQMLLDWSASLAQERAQMLAAFTAEIQPQRDELARLKEELGRRQAELDEASAALSAREARVRQGEETNALREEFLAEKEKILAEKFQKIAEERIAAAQAEAQAAHVSRDEVAGRLASVSMQLEAQKVLQNEVPETIAETEAEEPLA